MAPTPLAMLSSSKLDFEFKCDFLSPKIDRAEISLLRILNIESKTKNANHKTGSRQLNIFLSLKESEEISAHHRALNQLASCNKNQV